MRSRKSLLKAANGFRPFGRWFEYHAHLPHKEFLSSIKTHPDHQISGFCSADLSSTAYWRLLLSMDSILFTSSSLLVFDFIKLARTC
jgi:hypothetical protein